MGLLRRYAPRNDMWWDFLRFHQICFFKVEFMDGRFLIPGIRIPFVYYLEFDESGEIQSEGFVEDGRGQQNDFRVSRPFDF